jgi:hypothetical protein
VESAKEARLAEEDNPIRRFRRKCDSHARVLEIASHVGIKDRHTLPENEPITEVFRSMPELADQTSK